MKKFVALLLALTLVAVSIVSAMAYDTEANMKKWVDVDLEGYKVVQLFNYNETVAVNVGGIQKVPSLNITRDGKTYYHIVPTGGASTVSWDHVEETITDVEVAVAAVGLKDGSILVVGAAATADGDCPNVPESLDPTGAIEAWVEGYDGAVDFGYNGLDLDWNGNGIMDDGNTGSGEAWHYESPKTGERLIPVYEAKGEATRWIDNTVAQAETNPKGKTTPRDAAADVRYVISSTYAAGFEANEVVGNGSNLNVVPVDLTVEENTAFVYPIATKSHVVIGLLFAKVNVEEGFVQVEAQYKDGLYKDYGTTLTVYTTKAQLVDGSAANFELADVISIEEELGGAPAILISIEGKVTYPTLFGNLKSGKRLAYQDYFRYEKWAKTYRTNMAAALALVAD